MNSPLTLARTIARPSALKHLRLPAASIVDEESLGERRARVRKERGFAQVEHAHRIGITPFSERLAVAEAVVSSYERGELFLHGELIATLADLLRISTDELLGVHTAKSCSTAPLAPVVDMGLARRFALLGALPRCDREFNFRTIDALVAARDADAKGRAA